MRILRHHYYRNMALALMAIALPMPPVIALGPIDLRGISGVDGSMMPHGETDPHLQMTSTRPLTPESQHIADDIALALRGAILPYADISVAEADGYRPFPPDPSGFRIVHYVNPMRTWRETWGINPQEPGSLLYERQSDGSLQLIGAMFTAPEDASETELNDRVPLSVARWHLHVNICVPDPVWDTEQWALEDDGRPRFGPESHISTETACEAVGGDFWPTAFGWMVHAYVFAEDPDDIWNPMY